MRPNSSMLCCGRGILIILPLLHHHVAVPKVAEDMTVEELRRATPKCIILKADGLAVRKPHLLQHAVAIQFIGIVTRLPCNMWARFFRHLVVRVPCQSTARSLQYEGTLNVIEIVIMSVPENPAAPAILPITAVTAAEDVAHGIGHTIIVRAVLIAEFNRELHYSQMLSSKFPDEIVRNL